MRCVSSRFFTAPPRFSAASSSSAASLRGIEFSLRLRAASITQRIASARRRDERTSTGTWYVAPPTRSDFAERLFHDVDGRRVLLADLVDRAVNDAFGHGLLAALHHHVDEAGNQLAAMLGVRQQLARGCIAFSRH